MLKRNRELDAIAIARRGVAADPSDEPSALFLARLLAKRGQDDDSVAAFRFIVTRAPKNIEVFREFGKLLTKQGKMKEAVTIWKQAYELEPKDALVCSEFAWALNQTGDKSQAEIFAKKALALNPDTYRAHSVLAFAAYSQQNYSDAATAFERLVKMQPNSSEFFLMLGASYAQLGKLNEAEKAYRRCVELKPEEANRKLLIAVLSQQKKWNMVEDEARVALARNPASGSGYLWQGMAQAGREDWLAAEDSFNKALNYGAEKKKVLAEYCHVLWELGREEAAEEAFRASSSVDQTVDPKTDGLQNLRLYIDGAQLFKEGNYLEAEIIFRRFSALEPKNANHRHLLGLILYAQQKFSLAENQFRKAVTLEPKQSESHLYLGHSLMDQGKFPDAAASFRQAYKIKSTAKDDNSEIDIQIKKCEQYLALDRLLPDIVAGKYQIKNRAERFDLASLCALPCRKRYLLAATLYAELLLNDLAPKYGERYDAACAAVLASAAQGVDCDKMTEDEKRKWSAKGREWLNDELKRVQEDSNRADAENISKLKVRLNHWKRDSDLASIRSSESLSKMPEVERKAWQKFWSDVDILLKKFDETDPKK